MLLVHRLYLVCGTDGTMIGVFGIIGIICAVGTVGAVCEFLVNCGGNDDPDDPDFPDGALDENEGYQGSERDSDHDSDSDSDSEDAYSMGDPLDVVCDMELENGNGNREHCGPRQNHGNQYQ